ncbi:MAG: CHASE2 domain-containing protein [Pseudomonadota bacterium]
MTNDVPGRAELHVGRERWILGAALVAFAAALTFSEVLWDWDQVVYDRYLSYAFAAPPDDVLIVAIDEYSLAAIDASLGSRWPWPRALHAEALARLTEGGARGILLDVLFTEPDRAQAQNDAALAHVLGASGRVVLPVHLAGISRGGAEQPRLVFPIPAFASQAAALGHTHSRFDRDGILREASLALASGEQRIPHASASLLALREPDLFERLPGLRAPERQPGRWYSDYTTRFLFNGPAGQIERVAYADLLQWDADRIARKVKDRWVFVGATAPGMDMIPTPVSGARPMPGVEVNANIFQALRAARTVTGVSPVWQFAASLLAVLPIYLLFAQIRSRWVFPLMLGGLAAIAGVSVIALAQQLWLPPMVAIVTLSAAYLLWSFRRLGNAVRFLTRELRHLETETQRLAPPGEPAFADLLSHVAAMLDVREAQLRRADGEVLQSWAANPEDPTAPHEQLSEWYQTLSADGNELYVAIAQDELSDAQQAVLRALARRLTDDDRERPVTAVERIERRMLQVRSASQSLTDLRRFVAESLEQMASGVLVADALGQIREANTNAAQFTGRSAAQLIGQPALSALTELELHGQQPGALIRKVQLLGEGTFCYATGVEQSDLIIQITPYGRDHGAPFGIIINMSDISELRASERRRSEMLSFISHDLRSPLVSTLALTQIATLKPERLTDGKTVGRIESNVKKTLELADDFLHLARAESGAAVALTPVDFGQLARSAFDQVRVQAEQKSMTARCEIDGPFIVSGESGLLERAVVNLLTNAVKYSGEGASVTVRMGADEQYVRCQVSDTGLGIPAGAVPTLFDRFTRVQGEDHRKRSGAGLGLAFVHTVATRHGGDVEVRSVEGEGSTFEIRIPHAAADETTLTG